jgi:PAS domain S-box-containing protein
MWDGGQHRIFGVDPSDFSITRESVRALIDPEDWTRLQNTLTCFAGGEQAYQTEFRVYRPNGELRWCMGTASATLDGGGRIVRLNGVTVDITDRKRTEERQNLLAREADHRAKNALAVVQSIVRLTKADAVKDYIVAVEGRIGALARAHTLLAQSRWQGADLATLVDEELAPYRTSDAERITSGGPQVSLEPRTAQTIAVAVHELATNAAKHGALASLTGRVALGWELSGGALVMRWSETDEPAVEVPTVQGFGIKVITSSIEAQLGGKARFDWRSDGMDCTLTIPHLGQSTQEAPAAWPQNADTPSGIAKLRDARRVMIVEDEALIGMMMKDALIGLGLAVMGPFVTVDDAMRALDENPVDFAILDVNLGGEWVYPVADRLATRGIPFVFITGYGVDGLDGRFAQTPVFEKPIEPQVLETMFGRAHAMLATNDATAWGPASRAG